VPRKEMTPPEVFRYELSDGSEVLAGKTAEDNDILSLKTARPNDLWFHVRGVPGSHVLLRRRKGHDFSKEAIRTAAAVAAWHSKARSGGVVPVACTEARYVTKPRGARPGSVQIRKERVIKVRPALPPD
jgi:predicted ribosome quality control (RQC) complex YloA/Tae2 family protein